jgi:hypothetical protein
MSCDFYKAWRKRRKPSDISMKEKVARSADGIASSTRFGQYQTWRKPFER